MIGLNSELKDQLLQHRCADLTEVFTQQEFFMFHPFRSGTQTWPAQGGPRPSWSCLCHSLAVWPLAGYLVTLNFSPLEDEDYNNYTSKLL